MKAVLHAGRQGSVIHNSRMFDTKNAENISEELSEYNMYYTSDRGWSATPQEILESDRRYYQAHYQAQLDETNKKYCAQHHPERCKSVDDLLHDPRRCPMELIIQFGGHDDIMQTGEVFQDAAADVVASLEAWSRQHGSHLHVISAAAHFDELDGSPHLHLRLCWDYEKNGIVTLGQDRGLAASGVPLPQPDKKVSRYNNRLQTFTAAARSMVQQVGLRHGLDIDVSAPTEKKRHMSVKEYKQAKIAEAVDAAYQDAYRDAHAQAVRGARRVVARVVNQLRPPLQTLADARHTRNIAAVDRACVELARGAKTLQHDLTAAGLERVCALPSTAVHLDDLSDELREAYERGDWDEVAHLQMMREL